MGNFDSRAMSISKTNILAQRMRRQHLIGPLTSHEKYLELFRSLQPVSTLFFTYPGSPPTLSPRTQFNDELEANRLRARGTIVKGRFLGGNIGYVLAEDLEMYANTFQRPLKFLNETQQTVFRALQSTGPLTPRQIKEETWLLNKEIMPALHRLQKAFMVYEDQVDTDWDRGWYDFTSQWPDIELSEDRFEPAATSVLLRFLKAHVFATYEQLRDWSKLPHKRLKSLLAEMEDARLITAKEITELGQGWICSQDNVPAEGKVKPCVLMLHKSDMLVRSHAGELKRRFGGEEVLQYLLIDGELLGAVLGHWRIGPHEVSDVAVNLPRAKRAKRQKEILAEVGRRYGPPDSPIPRYAGKKLAKTGTRSKSTN